MAKTEQEKGDIQLKKVTVKEYTALKDKLLEVRRFGAHPIFIKILKDDTILNALEKADIPTDNEIKIEAMKIKSNKWMIVKLSDKAFTFSKIAVTTKVKGSY